MLDNGSIVTLLSDDGTWSQVSINGLTGYVMSQYLRPVTDSGNTFDPVEAGYEPVDEADYSGWDDPSGQTDETAKPSLPTTRTAPGKYRLTETGSLLLQQAAGY